MPTLTNRRPPYAVVQQHRKEITALLIAKGLREGHGKWGEVFARHLRKHTRGYC
jgi:hypothetical protein